MKILHVFDHSLPIQDGYSFRSIGILRQQAAIGWETVQLTGPNQMEYSRPKIIDGIEFERSRKLGGWCSYVPLSEYGLLLSELATRITALVNRHQPDIVHAHSPALNGLAAYWVCRKYQLPLVYEIRAYWEDAAVELGKTTPGSLRYRLTRGLEDFVARRASGIVTICEGIRNDLEHRGIIGGPVAIVPNSINTSKFTANEFARSSLRKKLGLSGKKILGFIGTFNNYEGLDLLLETLQKGISGIPNLAVVLVGGGPEESVLKARAREYSLNGLVHFVGRVPEQEVGNYYAMMDVMVYPRHSTRLTEMVTPLKPLEAMAARKVVVASAIGGHRELINDGITGLLFDAGNCASLAEKLEIAVNLPDGGMRLIEAAFNYVCNERSVAAAVARYQPLYSSVLRHGL